jgi:hypothetical protein
MIKNFFKHLKTVITHRHYVMKNCFYCGLYLQGLTHDLSKFSPTEFWESVKYYNGKISPIDVCKKENGVSYAWQHHKGRNKHHCEYWTDRYDEGTVAVKMPYKYALELVCDYIGAGIAYSGGIKNFSMEGEFKWWLNKRKTLYIHEETKKFVDAYMYMCLQYGVKKVLTNKKVNDIMKTYYEKGEFKTCSN